MQGLFLIPLVLISGCFAGEYCFSNSLRDSTYCHGKCCGSFNRDCCSSLSGEEIAAAAVGSIVAFIVLCVCIICIVKACMENGSHGPVVNPQPEGEPPPYGTPYPSAPPLFLAGQGYSQFGPSHYPPPEPVEHHPFPAQHAPPPHGPVPGQGPSALPGVVTDPVYPPAANTVSQ